MKRNAVAWAALVVSVTALAGSRFSTRPVSAVQQIPVEGQKEARALSEAFGAVADFARPSVVQIAVEKRGGSGRVIERGEQPRRGGEKPAPKDMEEMLRKFFDQEGQPRFEKQQFAAQGTGSGFVYDDDGHILTNNHVVNGADKIIVTFYDGETSPAKIVGTDPDADVAVIQVESKSYRPLPRGDSDKLRVGEWVMAIGSPFGLDQTVTAGIISATERGTVGINKYESFLQTDCAINPGNSGGPLVDMNGRVVGINSAIATMTRSSAGVGFAIPIDMASVLANKLIKDGKVSRARVGLVLNPEPITPSIAKRLGLAGKAHGVRIDTVAEGSPGQKAGLKRGDVILEFDGHPINTLANFRNLVSASDAGKSYALKFSREGKEQVVQVMPAPERDVKFAFEKSVVIQDLGVALSAVTPQEAAAFGFPKETEGLRVEAIDANGVAGRSGLRKGDIITDVLKGKKVLPLKSVEALASAAEGQDEVTVYVRSADKPGDDPKLKILSRTAQGNSDREE